MRVHLNYGRGVRAVDLPDSLDLTVIEKQAMPLLAEPALAMEDALARPVGCPPLAEEAAQARRVCILICDFTRPVPNGTILPPLIRTLLAAGGRAGADHGAGGDRAAPPQRGGTSSRPWSAIPGCLRQWRWQTTSPATTRTTCCSAPPGAAPWSGSTGASWMPTCASPRALWSRTSWPAGPAGAR